MTVIGREVTNRRRRARIGNTVRVHYVGRLASGEVIDTNGRAPMTVHLGRGEVIPGLEKALTGMAEGERKAVDVPAADAYGERLEAARRRVHRRHLSVEAPLEPGTSVLVRGPDTEPLLATVVDVDADTVELDANHPLAGKDLHLDIELVSIAGAWHAARPPIPGGPAH